MHHGALPRRRAPEDIPFVPAGDQQSWVEARPDTINGGWLKEEGDGLHLIRKGSKLESRMRLRP